MHGTKRLLEPAALHWPETAPWLLQVAFPFGGRMHEVHLPPCPGYLPGADEARLALHGDAAVALQCLTCKTAARRSSTMAYGGSSVEVYFSPAAFVTLRTQHGRRWSYRLRLLALGIRHWPPDSLQSLPEPVPEH